MVESGKNFKTLFFLGRIIDFPLHKFAFGFRLSAFGFRLSAFVPFYGLEGGRVQHACPAIISKSGKYTFNVMQ
jgi:hypothetical protein